jgi:2-aminoadipate transaminase
MNPQKDKPQLKSGVKPTHQLQKLNLESILSARAQKLDERGTRDIMRMRLSMKPGVIPFAGGLLSVDGFPIDDIKTICGDILKNDGAAVLQYGSTEGLPALREAIRARLKRIEGIDTTMDNIIILSGSQQGLDLVSKIFINPMDRVLIETPSNLGGPGAYNAFQALLEPVPMDKNGLITDELENKLSRMSKHGEHAKLVYIFPTFHDPTGITMSASRRKKLLDLAAEYNLLIIEDDPYRELRYDGTWVRTIKSMDKEGHVIYLGSFSKIISPALRIGWCVASDEVTSKLTIAKQSADLCTNTFAQHVIYEFINRNLLDRCLQKVRNIYRKKRDIMLNAMNIHMPPELEWSKPHGGIFIWLVCPPYLDTKIMFGDAIKAGISYTPGSIFYLHGKGANTIRLNFGYPNNDDLVEGVKRLSEVIRQDLQELRYGWREDELVAGV